MKQNQTIITNSSKETQLFAEKLARNMHGGEVICLYGDLGYGKTTFMQGFARGLGLEGRIISPTFIIMRSYQANSKIQDSRFKNFYHIDLYRINTEQEIIDLGLFELLNNSENIIAIEWPEKMGKLLPKNRIDIIFEYLGEDKRKIVIQENE